MTYHSRMTGGGRMAGDINTLALHWHGQYAFSLADEAERILSLPVLGHWNWRRPGRRAG